MLPPLHFVILATLLALGTTNGLYAQEPVRGELVRLDTVDHGAYAYYCTVRSGFAVGEVMRESRKRFPIGSYVDRSTLGPCIPACNCLVLMDPALRTNDLTEYCLFAGTNGIIGQTIVLFLDHKDRVADLRIIAWGR
jgi:hypothetical protein